MRNIGEKLDIQQKIKIEIDKQEMISKVSIGLKSQFSEQMEKIKKERELRRKVAAKKKKRADFSENILNELSPVNLGNFYQRAKKELSDFLALFHWNDEIGTELTDPSSKHPMRVVFEETCYLNKIIPQQVVDYQFLLKKRICDIED